MNWRKVVVARDCSPARPIRRLSSSGQALSRQGRQGEATRKLNNSSSQPVCPPKQQLHTNFGGCKFSEQLQVPVCKA